MVVREMNRVAQMLHRDYKVSWDDDPLWQEWETEMGAQWRTWWGGKPGYPDELLSWTSSAAARAFLSRFEVFLKRYRQGRDSQGRSVEEQAWNRLDLSVVGRDQVRAMRQRMTAGAA